jgi:UDPglucose 6-dehydrogenase
MKILIIGTGYVGLVSGTCFAEMGHHVTCLDINQEHIDQLNQGVIPIYEPGLEEMVKRNVKARRLHFTTSYAEHVSQATIIFIAVDTPISSDGSANTSQVERVALALAQHMQGYCVIVTKSTVPVGTTALVGSIINHALKERGVDIEFDIVSNPEFLKEGNAIQDFMKPCRVIVGVNTARAASMMKEIYQPFMLNHERLLIMDIRSAELAKYAANAMLATRISFMNEMAGLCEELGADVNWIRKAIGSDERIGNHFLYPGVGYGGSCLPKDVQALISQGNRMNSPLALLSAVHQVNLQQKEVIGKKIQAYFNDQEGLTGKVIGILGLSFKPDTDDMREASSLALIQFLLQEKATVKLFDPIALSKAQGLLPKDASICWCQSEEEVAEGSHALVLMTEWKQFRLLNMSELLEKMAGRGFFDGRNQYQPEEMARKGFDYFSIGRSPAYAYEEMETSNVLNFKTIGQ